MKKIGDFWVPDVDLQPWRRLGKTRRKTLERFAEGGPKLKDLEDVLAVIPRGDTAIDGGANVGAYSRIMSTHFKTVYAFEPATDTFAALQKNVEEWGLSDRILVFNEALSDVVEKVGLSLKRGGRSVSRTISGPGELPAIAIDTLQLEQLDFIKLDVEGHEYKALLGAKETLLRCRPAVMFEDKPGKRDTSRQDRDPHKYLESLGAKQVGSFGQGGFDWLYRFD
ncbi:MAG: FkbM family methyltransferase [Halioglobus sp.]|nr:FkbM family methyltransferase [Halioglobus sp.]